MADIRIRWILETVGQDSRKLLAQDRQIRRSLTETDRLQKRSAQTATQTGRAQQRGSRLATAALQSEGRAAGRTRRDVAELNRAQTQALSAGSRLASSARRIADAYRGQSGAARQLTRDERAKNRAQAIAAQAQAGGAGATRGLQRGLAVAAGGGLGARVIATFAGFEQQMDRVAAVSGAGERQMAKLSKTAQRLGAQTAFSAREAADGMYQLSTAGFNAQKVMRIIPGTLDLASASGVDLATAAELQASALRGFGLRAGEAGRVADVLATTVNASAVEMDDLRDSLKYVAPVARATGQNFEDMLAAIGLMGNVGVKGSQAGTTLRTALVRLTDPTEKARGALADLGIQAEDLRGPKGLLPIPQILGKIVRGAQDLDKGTRNAALARIFGREALSGMVTLVEQGPKALDANARALQRAEGQAKRTARTMRENVAGGWDEFTGSLETAAITLTQRFGPALRRGLQGAAKLTNQVAARGSDLIGGLVRGTRGEAPRRTVTRGPRGRVTGVQTEDGGAAGRIGSAIGGVARTIGTAAMGAGRQLVDAFKPAIPFLQNVLLPLLKGIGEGVLGAVVGAFRVVIPIIRGFATALGFVGKLAAPLKGVIEGVGNVIGFVFAGPILKGIALVGKLGSVFRLVGAAARILAVPIRVLGAIVGGVARGVGALASRFAKGLATAFVIASNAASRVVGAIRGAAGGIGRAIGSIVSTVGRGLGRIPGIFRDGFAKGIDVVRGLGSKFLDVGKGLVGKLVDGVKGIGGAIVKAFAGGIGFAGDIGRAIADWLNRHTPLGDRVKLPGPLPDFTMPSLRRGGRAGRFQGGGMIDALLSPGELVEYGGAMAMVPGRRTRADNVYASLPRGARVFTADGQQRLAQGESPDSALATQLPHFAGGGRLHAGRYRSTAYGPPWGGIQGTGVTATGVDLRPAKRAYGVAVDPHMIGLGRRLFAWPNPFGYTGPFRAFDTGGAIKGRRLDFYDWRGRRDQMRWGTRTVRVSANRIERRPGESGFQFSRKDAAAAEPKVKVLGRSARRSGALPDAFEQGFSAGQEGLSRYWIGRERNPLLESLASAFTTAGAGNRSSRYRRPAKSTGDPGGGRRGSIRAGGGWGGTENIVRRAVRGLNVSSWKRTYDTVDGPAMSDHFTGNRTAYAADVTPAADSTFTRIKGRLGLAAARIGSFTRHRIPGLRQYGAQLLWKVKDHFDHVHLGVRQMRRGGQAGVARLRDGGRLRVPGTRDVNVPGVRGRLIRGANLTLGRQSPLRAFDEVLGGALEDRLLKLQVAIRKAVRRGGPERVVQRLQSMLSLLDFELGRRIGRVVDRVNRRTAAGERAEGAFTRGQRRAGVLESSAAGIAGQMRFAAEDTGPRIAKNITALEGALEDARRQKNRPAIKALTDQLNAARDELDELFTANVERGRELVRATAQEATDTATHGTTLATSGLRRLELEQRLAGTFDAGGGARADYIRNSILPAIEGELRALELQRQAAEQTGDVALARQIAEQIDGKIGDKLQAQIDAQEAIAENTEPLSELSGALAFEAFGSTTTDATLDFGLGT